MSIIIRHVEGSLKGREQTLELEPGNTILLGRHPDCDIVFDPHQDIAASGRHARLRLDHAGRVWIEDIGSSNGTFVDGDEVGDSVELEDGSLVELGAGGPKFTVSVASAPDDMPATIAMSSVGGEGPPPDPQPGSAEHNAPSPPPEEDAGQGDDSDGKVGARTVAIMIEKAQTQSSKKFTAIIAGLAVLVFACIGVIVFLAVRGEVKDKAQEDELEKTREELASTREELENTRDEMQSRLEAERNKQSAHQLTSRLQQRQQFNNQLEQARVEVTDEMREEFEESQKALVETLTNVETTLNERYGNSLYMLGFSPDPDVLRNKYAAKPREDRPGFDEGFCTAFAITPDGWLATNAHCINALFKVRWDMARRGVPATYFAKRNNDSETVYPIKIDTAVLHPGYTHAASADVGLLQIDLEAAGKQSVDNHVWLASGTQAQELSVGQPIYTLGFPGKVMDPYSVIASFRGGNIARLTDFDSKMVDDEHNQFVWHTALISKGTSGSPIFDRFGRVIAVNNGTMSAEKIVTSNGLTQEVKYIYSADGLNFGVRVDVLHDLAERHGVELPEPPGDLASMDSAESEASSPADEPSGSP